jgi:hypothetical protein
MIRYKILSGSFSSLYLIALTSEASAIYYGGCSRRTRSFSGTSWTALTLEVGKSPTEVPPRRRLPVALPSAISEFASSSSPSWSPNRAVLDDGRQHGELDQGVRARPALGAWATRPGHAVNMLAEERRCKRHPGAASMQLHGCARHCGSSARASELSNLACRLRPASRTVAG